MLVQIEGIFGEKGALKWNVHSNGHVNLITPVLSTPTTMITFTLPAIVDNNYSNAECLKLFKELLSNNVKWIEYNGISWFIHKNKFEAFVKKQNINYNFSNFKWKNDGKMLVKSDFEIIQNVNQFEAYCKLKFVLHPQKPNMGTVGLYNSNESFVNHNITANRSNIIQDEILIMNVVKRELFYKTIKVDLTEREIDFLKMLNNAEGIVLYLDLAGYKDENMRNSAREMCRTVKKEILSKIKQSLRERGSIEDLSKFEDKNYLIKTKTNVGCELQIKAKLIQ